MKHARFCPSNECKESKARVAAHSTRIAIILNREMTTTEKINAHPADTLLQRGLDLLAAGSAAEAAMAFRAAIEESADGTEIHIEAHHGLVRVLRDAGQLQQSVAAALALIALTPQDPLAHTALAISLQHAGHIAEAEAASARARVLEWKVQLATPPEESTVL